MPYSKMMLTSDHQPGQKNKKKKDGGVYELMKADGTTNQSWRQRERAEMQQRGGSQRQVKQTSGDGQAVSTHRPYIDGERARLEPKIFFDGILLI